MDGIKCLQPYWIILAFFSFASAFNLNTDRFISFKGPNNSYFGFSLAHYKTFNDDSLFLVGAPKAQQTRIPHVKTPGTIFRCSIKTEKCNEVILEPFGNQRSRFSGSYYIDIKDNGWFGVTVDSQDYGTVVTCGHRWMNADFYERYKRKRIFDYYANGMCYTLDKDLNLENRMIPLISAGQQTEMKTGIPKYAFGNAGIAARFIEDKTALILGAPGVDNWKGSIIYIQKPFIQNRTDFSEIWKPIELGTTWYNHPYFGYSITSGIFQSMVKDIRFVIGAPRWEYVGKVYMIIKTRHTFSVINHWTGDQFGEYFGAFVCAMDVNADKLTDILIGSPLYQFSSKDQGIVSVYINKDNNKFSKQLVLSGSKADGARFGMTIADIGDLNGDGYNDVVIGAPFEDGVGAIYIYNGGPKGVKPNFSQKISAEKIGPDVRGFGSSFSTGFDIDQNLFNDIAVGSYESDEVFLFYGQPPITLNGKIDFNPPSIDLRSSNCLHKGRKALCFTINACISYLWKFQRSRNEIRTKVTLDIDTSYLFYEKRASLFDETKKLPYRETFVGKPLETCRNYTAVVREHLKDITSFITVNYSFTLVPMKSPESIRYVPVLDPSSPTYVSKQIPFVQDCGTNKCTSDLKLDADFLLPNGSKTKSISVFVGANGSLTVHVRVENEGDTAYFTRLTINYREGIKFRNLPMQCQENNPKELLCQLENLRKPFEANLMLELNWNTIKEGEISFQVKTTTSSFDPNLDNNNVILNAFARNQADITISGISSREFIHFSQGLSSDFYHKYEIRNLGPSPLDFVEVEIEIPVGDSEDKNLVFLNITELETYNGKLGATMECQRHTTEGFNEDIIPTPPPYKRKKRSLQESDDEDYDGKLDCKNSNCQTIQCTINNIKADDKVIVIINMVVNKEKLDKIKIKSPIIDFFTRGSVKIQEPRIQPEIHEPDTAKVRARFDTGRPPHSQQLPDWVIPVSIIAGMLLIIIVMLILNKLGFFNRKEREAMKQLMHSATVEPAVTEETPLTNGNE